MQASSKAMFPVYSLGWDKCTWPRRCQWGRDSWQPKAATIWAQLHLLHSQQRETVNSGVWSICPNVAICLGMRWITALLLGIDCNGRVSQSVGWMAILWSLMEDRMDNSFDHLCWRRSCFYYMWQVWKGSLTALASRVHENLSVLLDGCWHSDLRAGTKSWCKMNA